MTIFGTSCGGHHKHPSSLMWTYPLGIGFLTNLNPFQIDLTLRLKSIQNWPHFDHWLLTLENLDFSNPLDLNFWWVPHPERTFQIKPTPFIGAQMGLPLIGGITQVKTVPHKPLSNPDIWLACLKTPLFSSKITEVCRTGNEYQIHKALKLQEERLNVILPCPYCGLRPQIVQLSGRLQLLSKLVTLSRLQ